MKSYNDRPARVLAGALLLGAAILFAGCDSNTKGTACPMGFTWNGSGCTAVKRSASVCEVGSIWNGSGCVTASKSGGPCVAGSIWNGTGCIATSGLNDDEFEKVCTTSVGGTPTPVSGTPTCRIEFIYQGFQASGTVFSLSVASSTSGVFPAAKNMIANNNGSFGPGSYQTYVPPVQNVSADLNAGIRTMRLDTLQVDQVVGGWSADSYQCTIDNVDVDVNGQPQNANTQWGGSSTNNLSQGLVASEGSQLYEIGAGKKVTIQKAGVLRFGFNIPAQANANCSIIQMQNFKITRCVDKKNETYLCPNEN